MNALCLETPDNEFQVRFPHQLELSKEAFFEFCRLNPDLRIERHEQGQIIIMSPSGSESARRNAALTAQLFLWSQRNGLGVVFDSSAGFELPNGATRSPDASWIARDKWDALSQEARARFAPVCPDFVLELRSESDRLPMLQAKLAEYVENGCRLAILIDPIDAVAHVYRPDRPVAILPKPRTLSAEPEMPGLIFDLADIWA